MNYSSKGSQGVALYAQQKKEMMEKAQKLKEERKYSIAKTGEQSLNSKIEKNRLQPVQLHRPALQPSALQRKQSRSQREVNPQYDQQHPEHQDLGKNAQYERPTQAAQN